MTPQVTSDQFAADEVPDCPDCGAEMWDNRADNRAKPGTRRPDFRCKDNRDHVIWPPKAKKGGAKSSNGSSAKGAYSSGRMPELDDEGRDTPPRPTPAPPAASALRAKSKEEKRAELAALAQLQRQCAQAVSSKTIPVLCEGDAPGVSPESAAALINTLFIAAKERGLYHVEPVAA